MLQIYLGSLEVAKAQVNKHTTGLHLTPTTQASLDNFVGGALASFASQSVVVPIDVISQRLMVQVRAPPLRPTYYPWRLPRKFALKRASLPPRRFPRPRLRATVRF